MQNVFSIFFICLLNLLSLSAQVLNSGITNRYEGSGIIGKYKIEFSLDVIVSPYYERGDHVGEIQQFSGRYYYESQVTIQVKSKKKLHMSKKCDIFT